MRPITTPPEGGWATAQGCRCEQRDYGSTSARCQGTHASGVLAGNTRRSLAVPSSSAHLGIGDGRRLSHADRLLPKFGELLAPAQQLLAQLPRRVDCEPS